MGITGLWDVLGDGKITPLAEYAASHFLRQKRPLRVAVDEAGWRFNNLTDAQVAAIRAREPAANPIEKTILWRLLRLLRLNIQPLFVFDGPHRPWKRGRGGGNRLEYDRIRLLCLMLDHLRIPHHQAPGEAEAECAKLNTLGVVDAVWSDDGDAFMFGCIRLIKDYKPDGKRQDGTIQVYEARDFADKLDLDAQSFVCFAMLSGGDYDLQGLPGCGPALARLLARRSHGVAQAMCRSTKYNMPEVKDMLKEALMIHGKYIEVPPTYPNMKALGYYRNPTISTDEQLCNLRGLQHGWQRPMDQPKLRILLRQRFNFQTREYLKHLAPIFLVRALLDATNDEQRLANSRFAVQLKRTRAKKVASIEDGQPNMKEVKIKFLPMPAVEIDLSQEPRNLEGQRLEDWTVLAGKDGCPYDPSARAETELLRCFLLHGLADGALESAPEQSKRQPKSHCNQPLATPPSRHATGGDNERVQPQQSPSLRDSSVRKRGRPRKSSLDHADQNVPKKGKHRSTQKDLDNEKSQSPPPRGFRLPTAIGRHPELQAVHNVVSLCGDGDPDIRDDTRNNPRDVVRVDSGRRAHEPATTTTPRANKLGQLAQQVNHRTTSSPTLPSCIEVPEPLDVPGEAFNAERLRQLRAAAFQLNNGNNVVNTLTPQIISKPSEVEVIDLT